ncbi:Alpha/Beta hydrolase protein [Gongronella butleri]|nr:Alpha/Beta hydrolase protein [Gongronella butleri]
MVPKLLVSFFFLFSLISLAMADTFDAHRLVTFPRPSAPVPDPSGSWAVYAETQYLADQDKTQSNLYLLNLATNDVRTLTSPALGEKHSEPFFLDEHRVAFTWSQPNQAVSQLYVLDVQTEGAEPYVLTDFPVQGGNYKYNAAQQRLFFSAYVYPDVETLDEAKAKDDKIAANTKHDAKVYDQLMVRHWDSYIDDKRNQLFHVQLTIANDRYQVKDVPRNLLRNTGLQCPGFPMGDASDYDVSKDGSELALVSKISTRDNAWQTSQYVYRVRLDFATANEPVVLNDDIHAASSGPVYAPKSGRLAYLQMYVPQYEADRNRIVIYDPKTDERTVIAKDWDRSPSQIVFANDESAVYVVAEENGRAKIFAIDLATESITTLTSDHAVSSLSVLPDDVLLFGVSSMTFPTIAHAIVPNENKWRRLGTSPSLSKALESVSLSTPEEFEFTGAMGDRVHGWIVKPANFDASRRYPVAFLIHGGPQGAWEDAWSTRWNYQVYANAGDGFVTIAINFHGSTGYGQDFTDSIGKNWFSHPYEDLMIGLDFALEKYPFLDSKRVTALGASYGATMINWLNGHTQRFCAMVSHDGIFSTLSAYYSTEEVYFPEREFGGAPYSPAARITYEKFSPSNFVHRWATPTLVIHGGLDFRLTEAEGIAVFTALQRRNVPSRFVYFPNENHWVLKPANSLKWHEEVLGWIVRYTSTEQVNGAVESPVFQVQHSA